MNAAIDTVTSAVPVLPAMIAAPRRDADVVQCARDNHALIADLLVTHGGVLFRGFRVNGVAHFERFMTEGFGRELLMYRNRSTPRTEVRDRVYTSTEYPADQHIELHNENSYTSAWAERIFFHCIKPSETGGETPIADSRKVFERIPAAVRERFERHGVMYVRNYDDLDLPWQSVFQTDDPREVEAHCEASGIQWEWLDETRLRTREVAQATLLHPVSGEPVWFNQAHLFHLSSLQPAVRDALTATVDEPNLPRNAYFGDGSTIDDADLVAVRAAYAAETVAFPWHSGDILMLDNMLVAHGRRPFTGSRKVVVGMT
jgi:alpha-ketoglutarate-dependent taurine dioxygenase